MLCVKPQVSLPGSAHIRSTARVSSASFWVSGFLSCSRTAQDLMSGEMPPCMASTRRSTVADSGNSEKTFKGYGNKESQTS